jgi:hypothetical protein
VVPFHVSLYREKYLSPKRGGECMNLEEVEALLDQKYYSDERNHQTDPDGPYLVAFALVALTKEVRMLREQQKQFQEEQRPHYEPLR